MYMPFKQLNNVMTEENFNKRKEDLERFLTNNLDQLDPLDKQRDDIHFVLGILKKYNFYNLSQMKGLLARTVVDSLEVDQAIGVRIIEFDNRL